MAKYKATGCARFFIFLIIFLPIAYFGAKYLMDTGQIDGIREKIEEVTGTSLDNDVEEITQVPADYDQKKVQRQIESLISKVREQEKVIKQQAQTITEQKSIIQRLQDMRSDGQAKPPASPAESSKEDTKKEGTSLEELLKEAEKVIKNN